MIIECPSCQTKFSVETSLVSDVDHARFHCSRCDHYFEGASGSNTSAVPEDNSGASTLDGKLAREQLSLLDAESKENQREDSAPAQPSSTTIPDDALFVSEDFINDASTSEVDPFNTVSEPNLPDVTASWPSENSEGSFVTSIGESLGTRKFEVKNSFVALAENASATKNSEGIKEVLVSESDDSLGGPISEPLGAWPTAPSETVAIERSTEMLSATGVDDDIFSDLPAGSRAEALSSAFKGDDEEEEEIPRLPSRALHQNKAAEPAAASKKTVDACFDHPGEPLKIVRNKSAQFSSFRVLTLCIVPAIVAGAICLWSFRVNETPPLIANLFAFGTENVPMVAPAGISVSNLQSTFVTLENGNRVLEINGLVSNNTLENYKDVQIEAKLFDGANRVISSRRVAAANGLAGASTLSALDEASIERLQKELPLESTLAPGKPKPFRVLFTGVNENVIADGAAFYGARVYSVRQNS